MFNFLAPKIMLILCNEFLYIQNPTYIIISNQRLCTVNPIKIQRKLSSLNKNKHLTNLPHIRKHYLCYYSLIFSSEIKSYNLNFKLKNCLASDIF